MKKIVSGICAAFMIVGAAGGAVPAAQAAPMPVARPSGDHVLQVQFRRDHDKDRLDRHRNAPHRVERPVVRKRFVLRGGHGYYNGHRGYREYHRGYRQYNGWWFPPAAFVAGAILGGALAQ